MAGSACRLVDVHRPHPSAAIAALPESIEGGSWRRQTAAPTVSNAIVSLSPAALKNGAPPSMTKDDLMERVVFKPKEGATQMNLTPCPSLTRHN
jgi:hypothetical protein